MTHVHQKCRSLTYSWRKSLLKDPFGVPCWVQFPICPSWRQEKTRLLLPSISARTSRGGSSLPQIMTVWLTAMNSNSSRLIKAPRC